MITTRPISHDERDKVVAATDLSSPNPKLDDAAKGLVERIFMQPRSAYLTARQVHASATAAYLDTSAAADAGDERFNADFRQWNRTATRPDGKTASAELANLMQGTIPSELVNLPYRTEITKIKGLLEKLPVELKGDPAKLAALTATVTAFEPLVTAQEQASREKLAAGARLAETTVEFDRAYGKLAKALKGLLGDEVARAILPGFVRKDGSGGGGGGGAGGGGTPTP